MRLPYSLLFISLLTSCLSSYAFAVGGTDADVYYTEATDNGASTNDPSKRQVKMVLKCRKDDAHTENVPGYKFGFYCLEGPCSFNCVNGSCYNSVYYTEYDGQFIPSKGQNNHSGDPTAPQTRIVDRIYPGATYRFQFTCFDDSGKSDTSLVTYNSPSDSSAEASNFTVTPLKANLVELSIKCANSTHHKFECVGKPCDFYGSDIGQLWNHSGSATTPQKILLSLAPGELYAFAGICYDAAGKSVAQGISTVRAKSNNELGIVPGKDLSVTLSRAPATANGAAVEVSQVRELGGFPKSRSQPARDAEFALQVLSSDRTLIFELPFSFSGGSEYFVPPNLCFTPTGERRVLVCPESFGARTTLRIPKFQNAAYLRITQKQSGSPKEVAIRCIAQSCGGTQ